MAAVQAVRRRRPARRHRAVTGLGPARRSGHSVFGGLAGRGKLPGPFDEFDEYTGPLCPLGDDNFDMSRYLDFGSSEIRFAEFRRLFASASSRVKRGQAVVVTGDKFFGKTSLIQRCAAWLVKEADGAGSCRVVPVDLSDEGWSDLELIEERMSRTLDRILSALGTLLTGDDHARIMSRESATERFRELGRALGVLKDGKETPIGVAVVLQGYPSPTEIALYYNVATKGMVFFAEIFEKDSIREIRRMVPTFNRRGADCHILELGTMKPGDPDRFVTWIKSARDDLPPVSAEVVNFFENRRVPQGDGAGEMVRVIWGAFAIAVAESSDALTMEHIAAFYSNVPGEPA